MSEAPGDFAGFRPGGLSVSIPGEFFTEVLPHIEDPAELVVTLYACYALRLRDPRLAAVRASELAAERPLLAALAARGGGDAVRPALDRAVERGVLVACALEDGDALYWLNTEGGRRLRARVAAGSLEVPGGVRPRPEAPLRAGRPAEVYEQEIGMLTPAVAASLGEAAARYPEAWVVDALREAARQNARSWAYAQAILRRWEAEGRDDGTAGRDPGGAAKPDPYAHLIRRGYE